MLREADQIESIAIIGMAGRFPGATDIGQFWKNLCAGVESVTTFTDEQLLAAGVEASLIDDPNYVKAGVLLDGVDLFDAKFFGYTPREAELIDPQHRLFLECAWGALEDAGYDSDRTRLRIGVFAGSGTSSYLHNNLLSNPRLMASLNYLQKMMAADSDYLCTRVSYELNLKGPSLTIQTACSTSLVATHIACQSLLNGECDMALAGGVSIRIPQIAGYLHQEGSALSRDGRCRAFDASARGMMGGSGVGVVILKRLTDALEDGDCIRAVIRGSAINNDGAAKIGYTAPSIEGQASVIAEAQAVAGVSADEITYVEAHGTGTVLGDPIEVAGLTKAFRRRSDRQGFCAIGSVKTNIGHLDAAAGVAGLIKVVLALQNRMLPPSLNFETPNPAIDFGGGPFYVQRTLDAWQPANGRRVAGVSSFGIGGTNAHAVVEEAPPAVESNEPPSWRLLLISAKSPGALEKATDRLALHLSNHPEINLSDVAFTLQLGRKPFEHRRILTAQSVNEAVTLLTTRERARVFTGLEQHAGNSVAFMFPGQAAQYVNMGLDLYLTEEGFRDDVDVCCEFLKPHLGFDLRQVLYPPADKKTEAIAQLNHTAVTQPGIFVVEYALARFWMRRGVIPDAMIGHSIGEYVAACLAGVFSLEHALTLIAARGRLMGDLPTGSMLAVRLAEKSIWQYFGEELSLAAVNAPLACVASGPAKAIAGLQRLLGERAIECRLLQTSHAFHSQMMDSIVDPFRQSFKNIKLNAPSIPCISNVTGTWLTEAQATDPGYWLIQLRRTVRFADGIGELLKQPRRIFLEVGPGHTLTSLAMQHTAKTSEHVVLSSLGYSGDGISESGETLTTLGRLWIAGVNVRWDVLHSGQKRRRVSLPTYPFEGRRCWIEGKTSPATTSSLEVSAEGSSNIQTNSPNGIADSEPYPRGPILDRSPVPCDANATHKGDLQEMLAAVWRDVLGYEAVGPEDNFFELGGDSVLATQMFAEVEKACGVRLPLTTLYETPTIKGIARILSGEVHSPGWSPLVSIQPFGSRPPFFCFHGGGGNVLIYRKLSQYLGSDQPFYGLQSQGLDGASPLLKTIEEMAELYVKEIRRVQPHGPYFLGGYCLGGTIAYEAAQQLHAAGEETALLALFDTSNWHNVRWTIWDRLSVDFQRLIFHAVVLGNLDIAGKREFLRGKLVDLWNRIPVWRGMLLTTLKGSPAVTASNSLRLAELWQANHQASSRYIPGPYNGVVTDFRPERQYWALNKPDLKWDRLAKGGQQVVVIPGYPAVMLLEPYVKDLARALRAAIDAAILGHESHRVEEENSPTRMRSENRPAVGSNEEVPGGCRSTVTCDLAP